MLRMKENTPISRTKGGPGLRTEVNDDIVTASRTYACTSVSLVSKMETWGLGKDCVGNLGHQRLRLLFQRCVTDKMGHACDRITDTSLLRIGTRKHDACQ